MITPIIKIMFIGKPIFTQSIYLYPQTMVCVTAAVPMGVESAILAAITTAIENVCGLAPISRAIGMMIGTSIAATAVLDIKLVNTEDRITTTDNNTTGEALGPPHI